MTTRRKKNNKAQKLVVAAFLALGLVWRTEVVSSKTNVVEAMKLDFGLPGGGRLSFRDGLLRIQTGANSDDDFRIPWDQTKPEIPIQHKSSPGKGNGAFYAGDEPLPEGSFLGLYEGQLVSSRESLDSLHRVRKQELLEAGLEEDANKVSDYVLSLDGGVHFLDGFDLRYQAGGEASFSLAHLNHSNKDDASCNVVRKLVYLPEDASFDDDDDETVYPKNLPRVAFFASREISIGEELAFDCGTNFWKSNN